MSDALPPAVTPGRGRPPGRRRESGAGREDERDAAGRHARRQKATALRRERHQADYAILVIVVALTAIGILMVYSSSAIRPICDRRHALVVGPQIGWAALGMIAMAGMMRVDYRYLRFASVPLFGVAIPLLVLVFVPSLNVVVGGSARWLKLRSCPPSIPPSSRSSP